MDVWPPTILTLSKDAAKASERIPSNADLEDGDAEPWTDRLDATLGLRSDSAKASLGAYTIQL